MPYGPPIVWQILRTHFCKYGGWGWSELFSKSPKNNVAQSSSRVGHGGMLIIGQKVGPEVASPSQPKNQK